MATSQQLKELRRKHHLGEFSRKRKVYKHRVSNYSMARRKKSSRRHYSRGSRGMGDIWGKILGVGGYILFENYVEKMIPLSEPVLSVSELAVSYWLSKKSGFVGDFGKAGVYINAYQLGKYFSQSLPTIGGQTQVTGMFAY